MCRRKTGAKIPLIARLIIIQQMQTLPVRSFPVCRPLLFVMEQISCQATLFYFRHSCPFGQKKVSLLKHLILSKSHFTSYPSHTYSFPSHLSISSHISAVVVSPGRRSRKSWISACQIYDAPQKICQSVEEPPALFPTEI